MSELIQSWFSIKKVAERLWQIDDNGEDIIYLIEGSEKALLIDTGWGIGNLFELVSSLTPLPLFVVNTHCHPDHVCGNYQFEQIYIHQDDVSMMKGNFSKDARLWMIDKVLNCSLPQDFNKELWINASLKNVSTFNGNQIFDLGGRIIKVIEVPGHSPGSICLFDEKEGLLFTGDSIEEGEIWLHCEECLPLSIYLNGIRKLTKIVDEINYIFPAHGRTPIAANVLLELSNGVEKIVSGKCRGKEKDTFLGMGLHCLFDSCSILYREDNI